MIFVDSPFNLSPGSDLCLPFFACRPVEFVSSQASGAWGKTSRTGAQRRPPPETEDYVVTHTTCTHGCTQTHTKTSFLYINTKYASNSFLPQCNKIKSHAVFPRDTEKQSLIYRIDRFCHTDYTSLYFTQEGKVILSVTSSRK